MRVALVHDYLNQFGGGERVLLSLMKLFPDAPVYTLMYDKEIFRHSGQQSRNLENRVKKTSFLDFPLARRHHRWFIPLMPLAMKSIDLKGEYDLIISDTAGFAKGISYDKEKTKHISYIHTPLRYAWETNTYFGDSWYTKLFAFIFTPAFAYMRWFDYRAGQKPDILLANSHYIAGKIKQYYNRDAQVVYPPIILSSRATTRDPQYYLALGRFLEYKRFDIIIEAFSRTNKKLKIVGAGRLEEQLRSRARHCGNIEFLPFQSDEKLRDLYAGAKAFVMANEEDFGMVMAEAQACGTPVIAYAKGGALEIVTDCHSGESQNPQPTGVLFPEQTPESLLDALNRFETLKFDPVMIAHNSERFSEANFQEALQKAIDLLI